MKASAKILANEWSYLWHHQPLNISYLQAFQAEHGYSRHSHDYYVIAVVDSGLQAFQYGAARYITPVDGLILLNPGDAHTGEPVDEQGYCYWALYPTAEHFEMIATELGQPGLANFNFASPRADDLQMTQAFRLLLKALSDADSLLEGETHFLWTLAELMRRFGSQKARALKTRPEHSAVRQVCDYIHANYAQPISLAQLAQHVQFSRYYLLHTFRNAMGMPPYQYLESVRVREAQKLLVQGQPIAQVAQQVGFSSQSHFTQRFKQIIGVPPGAYARQLNAR